MAEPRSILILEDNQRLAADWSDHLTTLGYEVSHAENSSEARSMIEDRKFDVLILDVFIRDEKGVPVADGGIKVMGFIQSHFRKADRPKCIGVTGALPTTMSIDPLLIIESMGADIVLRKPFSFGDLVAAVQALDSQP